MTDHIDYPHWPGTLYDCPACEAQMDAEAAQEYDEQEHPGGHPVDIRECSIRNPDPRERS